MIKLTLAVGLLAVFGIVGYAIVVRIATPKKEEKETKEQSNTTKQEENDKK